MKFCSKCRQTLEVEKFNRDRTFSDGLFRYCRECSKAWKRDYYARNKEKCQTYGKEWDKRNPDHGRRYHLRRKFGLTPERVEEMVSSQGGVCPCCGDPSPSVVDHDHSCCDDKYRTCGSCVRGVLCNGCNVALGAAKDNPDILDALAAYLIRWKNREVLK